MTSPADVLSFPVFPPLRAQNQGRPIGETHESSRVRVLHEIASRYQELVEPGGRNGQPGDGGLIPLPPRTYTATVREFERQMTRMRAASRTEAHHGEPISRLRWHVLAWYLQAERIIRVEPKRVATRTKGRKHGRQTATLTSHDGVAEVTRRVDFRRHPDARERKAVWGLEWIADHWGLGTEPMLPDELRISA